MIYKEYCGERISALGFGTMRLPRGERDSDISMSQAAEMFDCAIKSGVNYFDTAYGYHMGKSEPAVGELLSAYPRESFLLATKFPGYSEKNFERIDEIFNEQLERCRVDYFDFYLFHNVNESDIDFYLNEKYDLVGYLLNKKAEGKIRHLGFSTHGGYETIKRFLDACNGELEFGQLEINWLDWGLQNAKENSELFTEYGIPTWVMEPVRGGKLINNLPESAAAALKNAHPERSFSEWAFRFIQSLPSIGVTLSGMSDLEQVKDNIRIFGENNPLSADDMVLLGETAKLMYDCTPCTGCGYCKNECPQELDIPRLMSAYNEYVYTEGAHKSEGISEFGADKLPSACIDCGACAKVCPQWIDIPKTMADFTKRLGK